MTVNGLYVFSTVYYTMRYAKEIVRPNGSQKIKDNTITLKKCFQFKVMTKTWVKAFLNFYFTFGQNKHINVYVVNRKLFLDRVQKYFFRTAVQ